MLNSLKTRGGFDKYESLKAEEEILSHLDELSNDTVRMLFKN